jgi:hypothetical protein
MDDIIWKKFGKKRKCEEKDRQRKETWEIKR